MTCGSRSSCLTMSRACALPSSSNVDGGLYPGDRTWYGISCRVVRSSAPLICGAAFLSDLDAQERRGFDTDQHLKRYALGVPNDASGLKNAPATFTWMVTQELYPLRDFAPSYFDDTFVHSRADPSASAVEVHLGHL